MDKTENTIRYAEMLLIYAEALNELTPGKSYTVERYNGETMTVQRDVNEMRSAMKPIRMRAGVPDFDDVIYANQELFRTALKRERQIELVGENCFRYYDLRGEPAAYGLQHQHQRRRDTCTGVLPTHRSGFDA